MAVHFASHGPVAEEVVAFEAKRGARHEEKTEKRSRKVAKSEEEPHLSEEEQEAVQSQPRKKKVSVRPSCESFMNLLLHAEYFGLLGGSKRRRKIIFDLSSEFGRVPSDQCTSTLFMSQCVY
jgi:hypothetical protein